ncbi:flagellar basal body rod protein FlgB [Glaciecola sp. XM2]|uniref:flagellar basal body rod protein FlgB n=1 Tax=Glaciecola sp. XM2 TaxID=1914931 RepID=UPI001BDE6D52|nr:flagellar basal body rod protein FlgB [Glaciecola sp. XM2]MBT1450793.1 flagellar basal body rod protein FlgB [Glaciecola sp. XM2]
MAINLDRLAGFHHNALKVRADKMEVIAGNLANANTPGYKARDIDFQSAMTRAMKDSQASQGGPSSMVRTHEKHIQSGKTTQFDVDFRIPDQPDTGDGNTVDVQQERNAFLENGMRYEASLMLLNGKFSGMKKALSSGGQ